MILSLDCSTLTLSLALLRRDGSVVEQRFVPPPKRQSELLPGELEAILAAHGEKLGALTGLVCGLGPGSFTGLRIGLATLKGLAYALRIPLAGASSLAALAAEAPAGVEVFSTAVVKKGEFYVGRYTVLSEPVEDSRERRPVLDKLRQHGPECSMTLVELANALKATPEARMIGPALTDWRAALEGQGVPASSFLEGPLVPSAVALARLASLPASFDAQAVFALEPHYLRGSGAEENPKFPPLPGVEPKARLKED